MNRQLNVDLIIILLLFYCFERIRLKSRLIIFVDKHWLSTGDKVLDRSWGSLLWITIVHTLWQSAFWCLADKSRILFNLVHVRIFRSPHGTFLYARDSHHGLISRLLRLLTYNVFQLLGLIGLFIYWALWHFHDIIISLGSVIEANHRIMINVKIFFRWMSIRPQILMYSYDIVVISDYICFFGIWEGPVLRIWWTFGF